MFNFPIIDLKELDSSKSKDELRRGFTDVGFFYVKNWGLTNAELEEIEALTRQVFTASDAEQNKLASYIIIIINQKEKKLFSCMLSAGQS